MRKHFMGMLLVLGLMQHTPTFAQQKPNIILFTVDDMGWQDSSFPFSGESTAQQQLLNTPNIRRLASMGVAFTSTYATPVCTPSRVSMMTGMNAARHGVTNWTAPFKDQPTGLPDERFIDTTWNYNGLSVQVGEAHTILAKPLPQILKDAGYFTIHVGKAHWAAAGISGSDPKNLGFVVNIAGTSTGRPQSYLGTENFGRNSNDYHAVENLQAYFGKDLFLTDVITQEALKTLHYPIQQKLPFFLNLSHYAVHDPYQIDSRYYQKYMDRGLSETEAKYAAMIEGVDKSLGDVIAYLEANNQLTNTYIVFVSDNGSLALSPPRALSSQTQPHTLRAGKGSVYEGGIRVPLIVKGNEGDLKDIRVDEPVIVEDLFPTVLNMAGIENPALPQVIDGSTIMPYLAGTASMRHPRPLLFHMPHKWVEDGTGTYNFKTALVKGHYKLIFDMKTNTYELYDLSVDRSEQQNVIQQRKYRKIKNEMFDALRQELEAKGAVMPLDKSTGTPIALPSI